MRSYTTKQPIPRDVHKSLSNITLSTELCKASQKGNSYIMENTWTVLCLHLNQVDRMAKKYFSLFPPYLELVMSLVHLKKPNINYCYPLQFPLIVLPILDWTGHCTEYCNSVAAVHQVNMGRFVITAPTFTSNEPRKMFQCCATILDWQLPPQELRKYIFCLLVFKHSNDAPKIQWTNVMLSSFNCMFKNSFESLLYSCTF